jgi:DNA-binding response OmpR family regulator
MKPGILLVDDEAGLLVFMKAYLSRLGFIVSACNTAAEAWKEFEARPSTYSLVLVDLTMPDLPGHVLARMVRERRPRVPLILASGYPFDIGKLGLSNLDGVEFLHKPFTPAILTDMVKRMTAYSCDQQTKSS